VSGFGTFRAKALLKLQSPDQLDQRVQVVGSWTWAALAALLAVVSGVVVWACSSTLATSITATGYVVPQAGWTGVQAPVSGVVSVLDVAVNARVSRGQIIATVTAAGQRGLVARAETAGYVAEADVTAGQYVQAGDQLAIVAPEGGTLVVHAFFPVDVARQIAPGVATDVALASEPPAGFGYVTGRVVSIGSLPATEQYLQEVLLNPQLATQVTAKGPVVDVLVALDPAKTPSGYKWSLGHGPPYSPLSGGLSTTVSIVVARQHPIQYVL
jgi:multidrug resistance efflux pump